MLFEVLPPHTEALYLEARGDGRVGYKLQLQSAAAPDGVAYQYQLPLPLAASFVAAGDRNSSSY